MARARSSAKNNSTANLGFDAKLWLAVSEVRKQDDEGRLVLIGLLPSSFILQTWSAWVQHFIHHLAPHGMAGFVLAKGSMSSNQSGEGDIRRALIEADLVDCMVTLPGQLFYSTQIPVCLWFLAKNKTGGASSGSSGLKRRNRKGETLFIDARKMGTLIDGRIDSSPRIIRQQMLWN